MFVDKLQLDTVDIDEILCFFLLFFLSLSTYNLTYYIVYNRLAQPLCEVVFLVKKLIKALAHITSSMMIFEPKVWVAAAAARFFFSLETHIINIDII